MKRIRDKLGKVINAMSYLGMVIAFIIMCITTVDVIIRKVSSLSILGSYELTELGMVIMIFFGIAALQVARGHVRVDMFIEKYPRRAKHVTEGIVTLIETLVLAAMSYCAFLKILDDFRKGLATSVLRIPTWPFCVLMFIGMALFTLTLLLDTICVFIDAAHNDDGGGKLPDPGQ